MEQIRKDLLVPKNDLVFHALFREENKNLTENLISAILGEKIKIKTTDKDRYLNIKNPKQKFGIMDLRTELEDGTHCNVEIQVAEYEYEKERFLYYWADAYSRQLKRSEDYNILHKTISIIILDHEIEELKGEENLDTKWQIRDNKTGQKLLTEHLEIVIIEIPKAIRLYKENKNNKLYQWMLFLNNPNEGEVLKIMDGNEEIRKAMQELENMSEDDELRWMAELRLKGLRDERAAMNLATKRGLENGMKQGIQQGIQQEKIEIAKKMLKENATIEFIEKVTELTEEEIKEIKQKLM